VPERSETGGEPGDEWTPLPTSRVWAETRRALLQAQRDRDHWKANHDSQVQRARAAEERATQAEGQRDALETALMAIRDMPSPARPAAMRDIARRALSPSTEARQQPPTEDS
jgi:hypothetical protein